MINLKLFLSVIMLLCLSSLISGTIINIPDDYGTIQEGINTSSDGDTVLVQPGMYVENINFNGRNIALGSMFLTTGDTSYIEQTVIDGDSSGSVVTFESGEDSTALLMGFTIQNGFNTNGGGVYCINSNPQIANNIIDSNVSCWGGGIYTENSSLIIYGNQVTNNTGWG